MRATQLPEQEYVDNILSDFWRFSNVFAILKSKDSKLEEFQFSRKSGNQIYRLQVLKFQFSVFTLDILELNLKTNQVRLFIIFEQLFKELKSRIYAVKVDFYFLTY